MVAKRIAGMAVTFGGIVIVTEPEPRPVAGVAPSPDAVQVHVEMEAAIAIVACPPAAVSDKAAGSIANEQVAPNCVILKIAPLTVMVPVRCATPLFGRIR